MHRRLCLLVALASALALGPAAGAIAAPIDDGEVTLRFGARMLELEAYGVRLRGLKPASGRNDPIRLPVGGGRLTRSGKGRLVLDGAIRLRTPRRAATLTDLVLDTERGTLSARAGGRRVELVRFHGLEVGREGFTSVLALRRMTVTAAAAAMVVKGTGNPRLLGPGQAIGSIDVRTRFARQPVLDGRVYLAFAEGFAEKLRALRINTKPLSPAWLGGSQAAPMVAIADTVGQVALDLSGGAVASGGGFALKQFESSAEVAVHKVEFDLDSKLVRGGITTRYTLPSEARRTPFATFRLPVAYKNAYTGALSTPSSPATMTPAFAARLNQVLAAPKGRPSLFEAGEPFGEIAFNLQTRRRR
jgi:hypothetical protein